MNWNKRSMPEWFYVSVLAAALGLMTLATGSYADDDSWAEEQTERAKSAVDSTKETIRPYKEGIEFWRQTADDEVKGVREDLLDATEQDGEFNFSTVCDYDVFLDWSFSAANIINQVSNMVDTPCENIDLTIEYEEEFELTLPDDPDDVSDIIDDPVLATFPEYDAAGVTELFVEELIPNEHIDQFDHRMNELNESSMASRIHNTPVSQVPKRVKELEERRKIPNWVGYAECKRYGSLLDAQSAVSSINLLFFGPYHIGGYHFACRYQLGFIHNVVYDRNELLIIYIEQFYDHYHNESGPAPSTSIFSL